MGFFGIRRAFLRTHCVCKGEFPKTVKTNLFCGEMMAGLGGNMAVVVWGNDVFVSKDIKLFAFVADCKGP